MAETNCLKVKARSIVRLLSVLIILLVASIKAQERDFASRSQGGALLCQLVEDFYSYTRSAAYGPGRWGEISECCEGQRQSPRNLMSSSSSSMCGPGQPVSFRYNSSRSIPGSLYNNGHDPTVVFHASNTEYLLNVPYTTEPYILENIHLHYCSQAKGSEHAIDGKFYQGEIHLVHYKASYGSLPRAVVQEDGIVVVAIMMQSVAPLTYALNQEMVKIINMMPGLQGLGKEFQLPVQVTVPEIFPASQAFFTYAGSMTSPPCSEAVRWIVLREPIYVSPNEMDILSRLPSKERGFLGQTCNDRPVQQGLTPVETNFACTSVGGGEEPEVTSMGP